MALNMSHFVPKKVHLRGILLHYFIQNKSAAEVPGILVEIYCDHARIEKKTCFENNDFDVENKKKGLAYRKKFEEELKGFLYEDSFLVLAQLVELFWVDHRRFSKRF